MQPPTDNLYKFLAIFGLVIVGFSIYIPLQRLEEFGRSSVQVDIAYQPIIDKLIAVGDATRAELECAISEAKKREGSEITNPAACENVHAASEELVALRAKAANLESERNFLFQQYRQYFFMAIFAGALGVGLCIAGFWLWYVRLQRYLDAAARKDA